MISVKSKEAQFQIDCGGTNCLDGIDSFDYLKLILVHLIHLKWAHDLLRFLPAFIHPLYLHCSNHFVPDYDDRSD